MSLKVFSKSKLVLLPFLILAGAQESFGGSPGSIFTTTATGSTTNSNQYESKCDVYLSGGGRGSGLADGDYYFQVTDPSGADLLSTDPVSNRRFRVSGGLITAFNGAGGPQHPTGTDPENQGAVTIRLANGSCPTDFVTAPSSGNVYKVWVTPAGSFSGNPASVDSPCRGGCSHGFLHSKSKTDNFKIQPGSSGTFCLTAQKLFTMDEGATAFLDTLGGWGMTVLDSTGTQLGGITTTGPNGSTATICQLPAGTYSITEARKGPVPPGCPATPPNGVSTPRVFQNSSPLQNGSATVTFTWDSSKPANVTISFVNELSCMF